MNRVLRAGTWILGIAVLSFLGAFPVGAPWGPCGPSNIWGVFLLFLALLGVPVGAIVSLIGFVRHRRRLIAPPGPEPR